MKKLYTPRPHVRDAIYPGRYGMQNALSGINRLLEVKRRVSGRNRQRMQRPTGDGPLLAAPEQLRQMADAITDASFSDAATVVPVAEVVVEAQQVPVEVLVVWVAWAKGSAHLARPDGKARCGMNLEGATAVEGRQQCKRCAKHLKEEHGGT